MQFYISIILKIKFQTISRSILHSSESLLNHIRERVTNEFWKRAAKKKTLYYDRSHQEFRIRQSTIHHTDGGCCNLIDTCTTRSASKKKKRNKNHHVPVDNNLAMRASIALDQSRRVRFSSQSLYCAAAQSSLRSLQYNIRHREFLWLYAARRHTYTYTHLHTYIYE